MKSAVRTAPARVLVADPPWAFDDALPGPKRGAVKHYRTLNLQSIKDFPLLRLADDAVLIMWRVASMVEEAYEVVRAWGFMPKSELVWVKKTVTGKPFFGMGRIVRGSHETAIVATRGKYKPKSHSIRTVFEAPIGKHSKKPDEFYELVEQLSDGPYAELFARRPRPGWVMLRRRTSRWLRRARVALKSSTRTSHTPKMWSPAAQKARPGRRTT